MKRSPRRAAQPDRYILGLMSGTSADGVDAAVVRIRGTGLAMSAKLIRHHHKSFSSKLRGRILDLMAPATTTTQELARLHADLGDFFARVAEEAVSKVQPGQKPTLVGLAGQTVCHLPRDKRNGRSVTLQIGEPARVSARLGIPVVAEFRQSDVAVGGQGAPLVPWTDWILFRDDNRDRAIQNIGGIGNVTWLPAGQGVEAVRAFDTGPGNMIIDELVRRATKGRSTMDRNGRRAAKGKVLPEILQQWLHHPFFRKSLPKTAGREEFGGSFVDREWDRLVRASADPNDWIATATAYTAHSIVQSIKLLLNRQASRPMGADKGVFASGERSQLRQPQLVLCGGGSENQTMVAWIRDLLSGWTIISTGDMGIPVTAKEAMSFAILAAAYIDAVPANLPSVTGADSPVLLGCYCQVV